MIVLFFFTYFSHKLEIGSYTALCVVSEFI